MILGELLIREQFLTSCHPSLSLYLKERRAKSLEDMLQLAVQFLEAQGGTNLAKVKKDGCDDSKKSAPEEKKPSLENEPRREGAALGNPVKDATRAQDEAEVRKKVNHEVIVPVEKTCRVGDVPTKRPPTTMSAKSTESVAQAQHRVAPELVKHQQRANGRNDALPVSNVSTVAKRRLRNHPLRLLSGRKIGITRSDRASTATKGVSEA
ncbi:hypothetical protein MTO96_046149 [Rhipicephalus appendiculatus]